VTAAVTNRALEAAGFDGSATILLVRVSDFASLHQRAASRVQRRALVRQGSSGYVRVGLNDHSGLPARELIVALDSGAREHGIPFRAV